MSKKHYYIVVEQITKYHKVYVDEDTMEEEVLEVLKEDGYEDSVHSVREETEFWVADSDCDE